MAIWQVAFLLVKEKHCSLSDMSYLDELNKAFPEEKSWCDTIRQYGNLESTCIEFCEVYGEISLRIDLRNITKYKLETIIQFANSNGLKIEYENKLYEPNISNFVDIIKKSNAYRFVDKPYDFLEKIENGVK